MIDVCLLGTGGMMPLPGRALTSLYLRYDGRALLIDCGEGTQTEIRKNSLRFKCIEAILITHFHADHLSGLPGLLLTLGNESREEPLHMYGPTGLSQIVNSMRAIVPELPYEIIFHELPTNSDSHFQRAGLDISAFPADHGIPCIGYSFALDRQGKFDPKRARENGIPVMLWSRLQAGESVDGFTPADVIGAPRRGLKLLYATDTRPVPGIAEYGREADLMILEGMYGDPDKQERAQKSGHMMMHEAAKLAKELNVRELWYTHYSPANPEPEQYEAEMKAIFPNAVIAYDGMSKTLQFSN